MQPIHAGSIALFEILSGADRDYSDADIAVGEKFHHPLDDLSVESETPLCLFCFLLFRINYG